MTKRGHDHGFKHMHFFTVEIWAHTHDITKAVVNIKFSVLGGMKVTIVNGVYLQRRTSSLTLNHILII
jgi:hypothetical protein